MSIMLELDIHLSPSLIGALGDIIMQVIDALRDHPTIHGGAPDEDPDLVAAWQEDLQSSLQSDLEQIALLVGDKRFGQEKIMLTIAMAEAILRGSSALRLRIQSQYLSRIPEKALEEGKVDFACLSPDGQKAYACYLFLATLQGIIITGLDPELKKLEGPS